METGMEGAEGREFWEVRGIRHKFVLRGHWWFDAGLIGLFFIALSQRARTKGGVSEELLWPGVSVFLESDGVVIEAPEGVLEPFVEACYEDLAMRWWNRSKTAQNEKKELVFYDREKKKLELRSKRKPTPIPQLSVSGGSCWRAEGEPLDALPEPLQKEVSDFLSEHKKSLWSSKKLLCYGEPVCHPQVKFFPKVSRGGGKVCSICGQVSVCSDVNQTSFPLFSSQSATFSFNSEAGAPDSICWECQLLGKFAVHAAYYKQSDDVTHILHLSAGDLTALETGHEIFGIPSPLRDMLDEKLYLSNFGADSPVLPFARLPYEVLWGFYLAAYEALLDNRRKRRNADDDLDEDDEGLDEESFRQTAALSVVLASMASKGKTFITQEVVSYTDTAYVFRLIEYLKRRVRNDATQAVRRNAAKFFEGLFYDLLLSNPQKPYDPVNGMARNRILKRVFEKKSILQEVERFVFAKSLKENHPWLGRILFFTTCCETVINRRDANDREGINMTKDQIALATKLGSQIVLAAKDILIEEGEGMDAMKAVKGDLFALRKTRTPKDFLEQLNRLQFRYGIVVNKEIASGVLVEEGVAFDDFKAYCMISALNAYNGLMRPSVGKTPQTEGA